MINFKSFLRENEEPEDEELTLPEEDLDEPVQNNMGSPNTSFTDAYGKHWKSKEESSIFYKKVGEYETWAAAEFKKGHSIESIKKTAKDHKIPDEIIDKFIIKSLDRQSKEKNLAIWARGELEKGHSFDSVLKTMAETSESKGKDRAEAYFLGNYMLNNLSSSEEESVEKITSWLLAEKEKGFKEDDIVALARKHKVKELILWCAVMKAYHKRWRGGPIFNYKLYLLLTHN